MSTSLFDPIKSQAKITRSVLVGFSGGKDSIVTLDLCVRYFDTVQPFFMYICPNLEFQEETLRWYENRYGLEIIRIPHFDMSSFLKWGSFRDPNYSVPEVDIKETYNYLREKTGIHWVAAGERIDDSTVRRAVIRHNGTIDPKRGRFWPVANWSKKDIMQYIKMRKLKLPKDSREIGFSFRSLSGKELSVIKRVYPSDYQKILDMYPFAGAAVERYERYGK